jgi:hypothetical protein
MRRATIRHCKALRDRATVDGAFSEYDLSVGSENRLRMNSGLSCLSGVSWVT